VNIWENLNSIPTNIYSVQLAKSYDWFKKVHMKQPSEKDWTELFGKKRGKFSCIEELNFAESRSTAIILLGLSGCGKTTFSLDFVKSNPNFSYCSYDSVEIEVVSEFLKRGYMPQEYILDANSVYNFGEALNNYKKRKRNIIIDGSWVAPNARGALIKTLRLIGYKNIILFSFLKISKDVVFDRLMSRAVRLLVHREKLLKSDNSEIVSNTLNWLLTAPFEEIVDSSEKTLDEIINSKEFSQKLNDLVNTYFKSEPFDTTLYPQMASNIFNYGIDLYVDLY